MPKPYRVFRGGKLGPFKSDIEAFLKPLKPGFLHETSKSFLKRHSSPVVLMNQLQTLSTQGHFQACEDLIHLIFSEGHPLSGQAETSLLMAKIRFQQSGNLQECKQWIRQAAIVDPKNIELESWNLLLDAAGRIQDGDIENGMNQLIDLSDCPFVASFSHFLFAYQLFWKNRDVDKAVDILEDLVQREPHFVKAWACLGFAYGKLGNTPKAQEAFGTCLKYESDPEMIQFYRGKLAS